MASEAILVIGLALAKCSVFFLVRRIGPTTAKICDPLLVLSLLWGFASVLAITINCSPSHVIGVDGFCKNQVSLSQGDILSFANTTDSYFAGN